MANKVCIASILLCGWGLSVAAQSQDADPTRPTVRTTQVSESIAEVREFRLTTVWYRGANDQGESSAVINDRRVERGDEVGAYVVEAIEPGQVLLKNDDGEIWLRVFRSSQLTIEPSRG